jgi:hypothetical protein
MSTRNARYKRTPKGKAANKRYRQSAKGRTTEAKARARSKARQAAEPVLKDEDGNIFVPVRCLTCDQVHHVNPAAGRVLGSEEEEEG